MAPRDDAAHATKLIFVDIDGVLNVGIRDDDQTSDSLNGGRSGGHGKAAPGTAEKDKSLGALLWTQYSRDIAVRRRVEGLTDPEVSEKHVEKLVAVSEHSIPSENATYSDLACGNVTKFSPVLASRLAEILHAAGDDAQVVLASNWRRAEHKRKLTTLEQEVSKQLFTDFFFKESLRDSEEHCAADRLRTIGDYLEALCMSNSKLGQKEVRILVLEDFFITPFDGWYCGRSRIDSIEAAEDYLRSRLRHASRVSVKIVHTYEEWRTESGLRVQIGAGLCEHFFTQALDFLSGADAEDSQGSARSLVRQQGRWGKHAFLRVLSACLPCGV